MKRLASALLLLGIAGCASFGSPPPEITATPLRQAAMLEVAADKIANGDYSQSDVIDLLKADAAMWESFDRYFNGAH